ncbi:MAG: maltose acetyltransferase [Thalassospira sp.]|nr:maltose acetyltransferase [Thalassospira sp.]
MPLSALEKMKSGDWYSCLDPALEALRAAARAAAFEHSTTPPDVRGNIGEKLRALFAACAEDARIEAPFHCAYGVNITLGKAVFLNAGCVVLDSAPVTIGDYAMLGPNVQIYCADHHKDPALRQQNLERAMPVTIGKNVWIGGAAIILPGITIGENTIIGAGSVVTKDVPAGVTVVGNPARGI